MSDEFVKLDVKCYSAVHERRIPKEITIESLAQKLELVCGISADSMKLTLDVDGKIVKAFNNQSDLLEKLSSFLPSSWNKLTLDVQDPTGQLNELNDETSVEKFELTDEEYAKRNDTVRAFKMQHKVGRFDDKRMAEKAELERQREEVEKQKAETINVGDRCEIRTKGQPTRRGLVKYVGETKFKPGYWIGVQLDEPLGKNDGSVAGERYFECPAKYGSFVKPTDMDVGDYPEEFNLDDL